MKKIMLLLFLVATYTKPVFAQDQSSAEALVKEGVALHDAGKYEAAIAKYDAALQLNPQLVGAMYEKTFSLATIGKNEAALAVAQKIMRDFPSYTELEKVYMIAGNALDDLNRSDEALKIYDQGIKVFPDVSLFYYNKALSLGRLGKKEEARNSIKQDLLLNPYHASGQRFMALYYADDSNLIPALFAFGVYMMIEPKGNRAEATFTALQKLMQGNASVDTTKTNTININLFMPEKSKKQEDDFSIQNLSLSLAGSLSLSKEMDSVVKRTAIEKFKSGMDMIIESSGNEKKKKGFAWKYYVPFYAEMKKQNLVETFCFLCFQSDPNKGAVAWLADNKQKVDDFYSWMQNYTWPKKID